jgi:hypothetical protein
LQTNLFPVKNKKWLILLIVAFPSLFWLILETSTINSKKLPHYGPKQVLSEKDTLFYQVSDHFYDLNGNAIQLSKKEYPLYAIAFVSPAYRDDAYRLTGLWEYINYKRDKVQHIPFVLVSPSEKGKSVPVEELKKLSNGPNVTFYTWPAGSYDSVVKRYFVEKPYYIDYSFFLLIDANRTIRGYYDARYVSELKRLIDEYKHLRLKEEKQFLIEENEIKKQP